MPNPAIDPEVLRILDSPAEEFLAEVSKRAAKGGRWWGAAWLQRLVDMAGREIQVERGYQYIHGDDMRDIVRVVKLRVSYKKVELNGDDCICLTNKK